MEQIAARYPTDREAAVFYALALNITLDPNDKTYANQLKAAGILEKVFAEQPKHPGVAHYLIHSYDFPPHRDQGPARGEALREHRPGRAARAAHALAHLHPRGAAGRSRSRPTAPRPRPRRSTLPQAVADRPPFLRGAARLRLHDVRLPAARPGSRGARARGRGRRDPEAERGPLRGRVRARRHPGALRARAGSVGGGGDADLAPRRTSPGTASRRPSPSSGSRAVSAPRAAATRRAPGRTSTGIEALRDALTAAKIRYWAHQSEVQRLAVAAWIARADGRNEEALSLMRASADAEDSREASGDARGRSCPARELLGELLIDLGQPAAALDGVRALAGGGAEPLPGARTALRAPRSWPATATRPAPTMGGS